MAIRQAKSPIIVLLVLILVAAGAWLMRSSRTGPQTGAAAPQLPRLTEFELIAASGETFQSGQLDGKVWVASYFFTQCGGNCRMLNMELARLQREYEADGLHFVSFTCDPKNDSPPELAKYAELLNADQRSWTFLTGELGYLKRIGSDLVNLPVAYRAHHTQITIVDRSGQPRGSFDVALRSDLDRAKQLIEKLLAEDTPEETLEPAPT